MSRKTEAPTGQGVEQKQKSPLLGRAVKVALEFAIPYVAFRLAEELAPTFVRLSHPESNPANNQALMAEIAQLGTEFDAFRALPQEQQRAQAQQLAIGLKSAAASRLQELGFDDPADVDIIASAAANDSHRAHLEFVGMKTLIRNRLSDEDVLENDVNTPEHAQALHTRSGHAVEMGNMALNWLGIHPSRRLTHEAISEAVIGQQMEITSQLVAKSMGIDARPLAYGDQRTLGEVLQRADKVIVDHTAGRKAKERVKQVISHLTSDQKAGLYGVALSLAGVNALTTEQPLSREAQGLVYLNLRVAEKKQARLDAEAATATPQPQA